ncbi:efflux RND transporter periplasmic adaptor subunit [Albimonas pacifica]|uniref:Membrane fusion protein, multidrug efflux system n=1 Tax=Albimonas pacifica TaxID=1114924 RepID=A0A1I3IZW6_9RHOB|nr:efflux RND transporter periplasmic adaptor subunit [Albimonas pacifica]SFI53554.1 membrane fusion protein, multidrug efflux system [Albimonas pacifica]
MTGPDLAPFDARRAAAARPQAKAPRPTGASRGRRRAAGRKALLAGFAGLLCLAAGGGLRADPLVLEGRVEASERAVLASRLDGVVVEILFEGGDAVAAGQPLIRLDPTDAEIALEIARARVDDARHRLEGASKRKARQETLHDRGITADSALGPARTEAARAEAALALAEAEERRAGLDLHRTVIRAPISGLISPPGVAVGAYLEAKAAPPLATIVAIDPARVAYRVSYAERLATLDAADANSVEELLSAVRLRLRLPGGRDYPAEAIPHAASAEVDAQTGAVTVWARFPNPDSLLRPGMAVTVLSRNAWEDAD